MYYNWSHLYLGIYIKKNVYTQKRMPSDSLTLNKIQQMSKRRRLLRTKPVEHLENSHDLLDVRAFESTTLYGNRILQCISKICVEFQNFSLKTTYCPACRTTLIATRFWVVMICPIIKCLTVLEFSFILFDLCLFITIINFILNYVPFVTFWISTYHKIWILLIIFCFIWSYWIIYFLTCLEVFWSIVS